MEYTVKTLTTQPTPTAVVAADTNWQEFPKLWGQLLDQVWAFIRIGGAEKYGHNVMLYKDDRPSVEVGVQVAGTFEPQGNVVPSTLPAGEAAMTIYRGPYRDLGKGHDAVVKWCVANNRERTGVRWEIYGDPHDNEAENEVEIYWQLR
jgi:effector-binding domain-containing protein